MLRNFNSGVSGVASFLAINSLHKCIYNRMRSASERLERDRLSPLTLTLLQGLELMLLDTVEVLLAVRDGGRTEADEPEEPLLDDDDDDDDNDELEPVDVEDELVEELRALAVLAVVVAVASVTFPLSVSFCFSCLVSSSDSASFAFALTFAAFLC